MIDTHAHLDFKDFDEDREEVIRRAFDNGINKIINIGVNLATSRKSIELAERHENIFASVGFHPHELMKHVTCNTKQDWIQDLRELAENKEAVAIGECGLDYFSHTGEFITDAQKENQKAGFVAQINLAEELNLPVVVHCRQAWGDLYEIISGFLRSNLKNEKLAIKSSKVRPFPSPTIRRVIPQGQTLTKFVLHCYSGDAQDTEKFLKLPNVSFSFTGNITYPKPVERAEILENVVKMIPLERMMLDTDCPFLAPQEVRGKRNEPASARYIAERIAEIKEINLKEVEEITDANAETFFGI